MFLGPAKLLDLLLKPMDRWSTQRLLCILFVMLAMSLSVGTRPPSKAVRTSVFFKPARSVRHRSRDRRVIEELCELKVHFLIPFRRNPPQPLLQRNSQKTFKLDKLGIIF